MASSRVQDAPQKPNRPSPVQDLERAGFRRPALPSTVYAVDGMGSPEAATVERTTWAEAQMVVVCFVCLLERSDLSYIATHAGGRPTETFQLKFILH